MCGFLCVVSRQPLGETVHLHGLNKDVLRHRGPDSSGEVQLQHAFVRHWRLSIVDLSETSSQPYGDGRSWLIYNGEIYNYQELASRLSLHVPGDTPLLYELCKRGIETQELKRARGFYSYLYLSENGTQLWPPAASTCEINAMLASSSSTTPIRIGVLSQVRKSCL